MVNIIVVFPKLEDAKNIRGLLMRNGYEVAGICTSGAQALQMIDGLSEGIILCGYKFTDMLYSQLYECLPNSVQMLLAASPHILSECRDNNIICLALPFKVQDLINTLEMMAGTMLRRKKREKPGPKQRSKKDRRVIEEAKKLLMERNNMTEEEAHRYIQKCSMDSGNDLAETAGMIFCLMKF